MADLQGYFMFFKHSEKDVFTHLADFAEGAKQAMMGPPAGSSAEAAGSSAEAAT